MFYLQTRNRRFAALLALLVAALAFTFALRSPIVANAVQTDPITAAWQKAQASGSYEFSSDITQMTIPTAKIINVGRTSRSEQLHLEGESDLRQKVMEMRLWANGGTVQTESDSVGMKFADGKTFVRKGTGEWKEDATVSLDGIAPQGDFMSYLVAMRDVQANAEESRNGIRFTRYSFTIDGPTFARHIHKQMEAALRAKGELPAHMNLEIPRYYQEMTGSGEVWIGEAGLLLRQVLTLQFPEQKNEQVHAQIVVDFSKFGNPVVTPFEMLRAGNLAGLWIALPQLVQEKSPALPPLLLLSTLLVGAAMLVHYRRARVLHSAVTIAVISSMLLGPALTTISQVRFFDIQRAKAAASDEQQAILEQEQSVHEALGKVEFDPHQNPLEAVDSGTVGQWDSGTGEQSTISDLQSPIFTQALPNDSTLDTDKDGLSDFVEERIGTSLVISDTDADGLTDKLEVDGIVSAGRRWYTNPDAVDSNGDGQGDLLEWGMFDDGRPALTPRDTDGDGTPDLFDADNDGDGVPDGKDMAPYNLMRAAAGGAAYFNEATPFKLTVNNLAANTPVFVDFQLRPKDVKHLWFAYNVLDWPQDVDGQVRDIDNKTFADVTGSAGTNGANGDLKLTPMLEIRISGATTNLPQQNVLDAYNVTLNNFTSDGSTKLLYVPLSIISDENSGQRVAFNGRMRYNAAGSWPAPHDVRLAWVVQGLVDRPCDPNDAQEVAQGCQSDGYIHNVQQVLHSYYDEWSLTGISVREDRGASQVIVYEDPAVDSAKKDDFALWALSDGLNERLLGGAIDLNEVVRRFDRLSNSGDSETQRWAIPNRLRVEKKDYPTFDEAVITTAMTETKRILNSQFASAWQADNSVKPFILFANEQRFRALGLDGVASPTGNALVLDFSAGGQASEVQTVSGLKATPYCATAGTPILWDSCDADLYWTELEQRHLAAAALPSDTDPDLALGRMMSTELYFLSLLQGASSLTKIGVRSVSARYTLRTDTQIESDVRLYVNVALGTGVPAIANLIIMAGINTDKGFATKLLGSTWKSIQRIGLGIPSAKKELAKIAPGIKNLIKKNPGKVGLAAGVSIVSAALISGLLLGVPENELGQKILIKIAVVSAITVLSVVMPILDVVEAVGFAKTLGTSGAVSKILGMSSELVGSSRTAGAIGAVIAVGITWGFFIYSMVANKVSAFSPEFNRGLAETIAATIYILVLTLVSSTVIGTILVAIVAIIDAILTAICELGVDELRTVPGLGGACFTLGTAAIKVIAYLFYNYDLMVDTSRSDLMVTDAPKVKLADPSKGYSAGNSVSVELPITTTVTHKEPDPAQGLMIYLYEYFFSESNIRSSTVKYSLSKGDAPQTLTATRDEMTNAWSTKVAFESNRGAYSKDFYSGQARTNPAPVAGIGLQAGINQPATFYLNQGYAYPAYECWLAPLPFIPFVPPVPVCYVRTFDGNSSTKMENLKYDVYPASLDGFMTLVSKGDGGVGLAWDAGFPSLKDADGDGLLSNAYNGLDPNDLLFDSDNDGLSDANELERRQNGEPYSPISCDSDLDGLTDEQEMQISSSVGVADSDNDGLKDGEEVWHRVYTVSTVNNQTTCTPTNNWAGGWDVRINATTPLVVHVSSNPNLADSDGDGISDLAEKQLAESTCTAQEVANGRKCEGNPLKPVDKENQPYHPNVVNIPPLVVTVEHDDFDGYVLPGQSLRYTSTAVATAPLAPSVLDVTHPAVAANAAPAPALLPFNPANFTGSQTVTVPSNLTIQGGATTQRSAITSTVRARLAPSSGAAWVFDPVVSEPQLGGFTTPLLARNTGLSANRSDRTDSYRLSALLSDSPNLGGAGDIQSYSLPSGVNLALDNDNNNKNILRGVNAPRSATNQRGDTLIVWDQVENCRVLKITLLSIAKFPPDHVTSGIEPYITVRDSAGNEDITVWTWRSVRPADLQVGTYAQGFPVNVNVCGDYTISMWESGNASGGNTLIRSQTLRQNTDYNLTLSMSDATTEIFIDVNTPLRDRHTVAGVLLAADGTLKRQISTWPRSTTDSSLKLRSANPVVASNGDGFVVVYEQSQESANSSAEHFVMSQGFDRDGNALSSSSVSVGSVNYDVGRGLEQDVVWMGDRYRVAMKGVKFDTIYIADFATNGTRNGPFSILTTSSVGNNLFNSAPSLAWDPVSGRWAIAYPLDASIQIKRYPAVSSATADISKSVAAFPNQVKLAWNPQNRGWLVASDLFLSNQGNRQQFIALDADLEQRAGNAAQTSWATADIPGNALACPAVTALPVLDLRMEELPGATSFVDSSGGGNNAICGSASQCPTAGAAGGTDANNIAIGTPASDYALAFNTNQYLRVPNNASLNFDTNRSFTWLTWVKTTVSSPIMRKGLGGSSDLMLYVNVDGRLAAGFGNVTSNTLNDNGLDLRDNKWHQVGVTLDRTTNTATLYVDGSQRLNKSVTGSFVTADALFIGSSNAAGYSGALDNLQIYHTALAADTISALYRREMQSYCIGSSPTQSGNGVQWAKLKVREADRRGGSVTTSGSTSFIVDGDKPTASVTSLQDGEIVLGRNSSAEPPSVIIIGGSASDATSGVAQVEVRINNGAWELASGKETWAYALTAFTGSYIIETRATDNVGNVSSVSAPVTIHTDYRAPQMTMTAIPPVIRPQRNDDGRFFITLTGNVADSVDPFESGIAAGSVQVQLVDTFGQAFTAPQTATITGGNWRVDYLLPDGEAASNIVNIDLFAADKVGHTVKQRYSGQPGVSDQRVWLDRLGPSAALVTTNVGSGILTSTITGTVTIGGRISDTYSAPTAPLIHFVPLQQVLPYRDVVMLLSMEENVSDRFFEDSSVEINHARCGSANQCPTPGGAGRNGRGLSFNGNQYLRVRNHPTLNFDASSSFSWQAWVKSTSTLATNPIMRKGLGNVSDLMLAINSSGQAQMSFGTISGSTLAAGPNLRDNQWHQLVVTLERSNNRANIYVDGVGYGGGTFIGNFTTPDDLLIGSGNFQGYQGSLDQVALFRHALSAAEVQALYQAASRPNYPATLVGSNFYNKDWLLQVQSGLEAIYQIDAPAADSVGNSLPNDGIWRGLIDNVAPRVTISGTATGQSVLDANNVRKYEVKYSCVATDWQLDESKFNCPGNAIQPASRGFNNDPILQSQFPTLTLLSTLSNTWTIWQPSNIPNGTLTACDTTGKCSTSVLGSGLVAASGEVQVAGEESASITNYQLPVAAAEVAAVPSEMPNAEIINPTDGSFVGSAGVVEVTVAAEAAKTLREVTVLLDGEAVATLPFARIDKITVAQQSVSIPMSAGEHTLEARASDWAGNMQPAGTAMHVTLVTKDPAVALATTKLTISNTYQAQSGIVIIQGTVDDTTDNLAAVQVKVGDQPYADALVKDGVWGIAYPVLDPENRNLAISVRAIDKAGQITKIGEEASTDFAEGVEPETTIVLAPPASSTTTSAVFSFTGTLSGTIISAFECQLDDGAFTTCTSPVSYSDLSNGSHTFRVHAINSQGTQDPTPAEFKWTVNGAGKLVDIDKAPAASTTSRTAHFEFKAGGLGDVEKLECSLDGSSFNPCTSPKTYTELSDGPHSFQVRVPGNPASKHVWKVSNIAPVAANQVVTTAQNSSLPVTLQASDESTLKYIVVGKPANGTLVGTAPNLTYQPATDFFGTDSFSFKADDGDASSNLATVVINVTPAPGQAGVERGNFVAFGQEGVIVRENVKVVSGDIAASLSSQGPWLGDGAEVSIGRNVMLAGGNKVMGDTIFVGEGTTLGDVNYNELRGPGTANGTKVTPQALPLLNRFISLPAIVKGKANVDVASAGSATVAAGSYLDLNVGDGATVVFSGGLYHFQNWNVGKNTKLHFTAGSEVRISGRVLVNERGYVGPAPSSTVKASQIVIFVAGTNANIGNLGGLGIKSATFGPFATLAANITAPNGTLLIRERSKAVGSFVGRWVSVGKFSELSLDNRFASASNSNANASITNVVLHETLLAGTESGIQSQAQLSADVDAELAIQEGSNEVDPVIAPPDVVTPPDTTTPDAGLNNKVYLPVISSGTVDGGAVDGGMVDGGMVDGETVDDGTVDGLQSPLSEDAVKLVFLPLVNR